MRDQAFISGLRTEGTIPPLDETGKALLSNLTTTLGGGTRTGERARTFTADKIYLCIQAVAKLTGNKLEDVACCWEQEMNEAVLKRYKYRPPQLPLKGTSIQAKLADYAEQCYLDYTSKQATHVESQGLNFMASTEFTTIRNLFGVGMRFSIHYWMLNPTLTRKEAFDNAKAHMFVEIKPKHTPKHIMDRLLSEREHKDAKEKLLKLPTRNLTDDEKKLVKDADKDKVVLDGAEDDDELHEVIEEFLKVVKFKWKMNDHPYGIESALWAWIETECPNADKATFASLSRSRLTFLPGDEYLETKKNLEANEAKKAERAAKQAKQKKDKEEKKKKVITQQMNIVKQFTGPFPTNTNQLAPARSTPTSRTRTGTRVVPTAEELKAKHVKQMKHFMDTELPVLPRSKISVTTLSDPDGTLAANGPQKIYKDIAKGADDKYSCEIQFVSPGKTFCMSLKKKLQNVRMLLGLIDIQNASYMESIYADVQEEIATDHWIPSKSIDYLAAAFAEAADAVSATTDGAGNITVDDVAIDVLSSGAKRMEFVSDVEAIQEHFLNVLDRTTFGSQIGAFAALHREMKHESPRLLIDKALNEMPENDADQLREWMAIVDLLRKKKKSENVYRPFEVSFDCVVPGFENIGSRQSGRKRQLPTNNNGTGNMGSCLP